MNTNLIECDIDSDIISFENGLYNANGELEYLQKGRLQSLTHNSLPSPRMTSTSALGVGSTKGDISSGFQTPQQIWSLASDSRIKTVNPVEEENDNDVYSLYKHSDPDDSSSSSSCSPKTTTTTYAKNISYWNSGNSNKRMSDVNLMSQQSEFIFCPLGPLNVKSSRAFHLRIFQITSISLAIIAFLCILVSNNRESLYFKSTAQELSSPPYEKFDPRSWVTLAPQDETNLKNTPTSNRLLDLENFHYILNNASKCNKKNSNDQIFFVILIHSAPGNFEERQAIRSTWGSVQSLGNHLHLRLIFLLGTSEREDFKMKRESTRYGDLVSGSFVDSYRNLTYKHLMGYKWVLSYCPDTALILKTDDDAFVDIFQLVKFIKRTFGESPSSSLVCNVLPEGTRPVRTSDSDSKTKWAVTREEYPFDIYPKYCSGLAYLATPDVIKRLFSISGSVKFMWIDDVFVTGIVRELAMVQPLYLNLRYSYEPKEYRKWLKRHDNNYRMRQRVLKGISYKDGINNTELKSHHRLPFIFAHLDRGATHMEEMKKLWHSIL